VTYSQSFTTPEKDVLADWLVGLGPLVATGDMYALQYFLLVLTSLHGTGGIRLHDAWSLKNSLPSTTPLTAPSREAEDLAGSKPGHSRRAGGQSELQRPFSRCLGHNSLFPDAPQSELSYSEVGEVLHPNGIPFSYRKSGLEKIRLMKTAGYCSLDGILGQEIEARGSWQRWAVRRGARRHVQLLACSQAGASELARSRSDATPKSWTPGGWARLDMSRSGPSHRRAPSVLIGYQT